MQVYHVSIYELDNDLDSGDWLPELVMVVPVAEARVLARHGREAAAKAFIRTVGRERLRRLLELKAPACCMWAERDLWGIMYYLELTTTWLGKCWTWGNLCQAWVLKVELIRMPADRLARLRERHARRKARRREILRRWGAAPSGN